MRRIQRKRTKGWRMPENTVYVGRPSKWGNPFNINNHRYDVYETNGRKRLYAMLDFGLWLRGDYPDVDPERRIYILDHLCELKGKNVACWCSLSEYCHADVLLSMAKESHSCKCKK